MVPAVINRIQAPPIAAAVGGFARCKRAQKTGIASEIRHEKYVKTKQNILRRIIFC